MDLFQIADVDADELIEFISRNREHAQSFEFQYDGANTEAPLLTVFAVAHGGERIDSETFSASDSPFIR